MPQLHCYVPDRVAARLRQRAGERGLSVSRYLAELVRQDIETHWPEGFFEQVVGGWQGERLARPERGALETRDMLAPADSDTHVSA